MVDKNIVKIREDKGKSYVVAEVNTYAHALEYAARKLRELRSARGTDLSRRYLLIVPDKYTLIAEKLLTSGGGTFDSEALTFNRLCYRIAEYTHAPVSARPLTRQGAVLTVRRILGESAHKPGGEHELKCYSKSAKFPGFGEILYDNICQLAASGISSEDLPDWSENEGVLGCKLRDLKLVYGEYEKATRGKYVDSSGRLAYLLGVLEDGTDYFDKTDVCFAGYEDFTPLQARIADRICGLCRAAGGEAAVVKARCVMDVRGEVEQYTAPSRADELKAAAVRIRALAARGVRYGEMGVIAPGADCNRLQRIFGEYAIPYTFDKKYCLSSHPLANYMLDLLSAAHRATVPAYIKLAKNPYSGISREHSDIFENYVNYCALPDAALKDSFTVQPDAAGYKNALAVAENVRSALAALTGKVRIKDMNSGEGFCREIKKAVPKFDVRVDSPISDVADKIAEYAEMIGEVFDRAPFADLYTALEECFGMYSVSTLPPSSDAVTVGEPNVFRAGRYRYLFVLDMHDSEIPAVLRDDGLLSDRELDRLASAGVKVEPKTELLNSRAEAEIVSILSSGANLFLSYLSGQSPSQLIARAMRSAAANGMKTVITGKDSERESLYEADRAIAQGKDPDAEFLAFMCPTRESAAELCLIGRSGEFSDGLAEVLARVSGVREITEHGTVAPQAGRLYPVRTVSVSRIQEYFACPRRCLVKYGLGVSPRPNGEVSVLDLGIFLHKVIELYLTECRDRGDFSHRPEDVKKIIADLVAASPQTVKGIDERMLGELTDEAAEVSGIIVKQIVKGEFRPAFFEKAFGFDDSDWDGLDIDAGGVSLKLNGYIDRLDITPSGAARVIDYKTGYAEFGLSDVYYGRKLQLALYLKVAKKAGYTPAGMFFFPFSTGFERNEFSYRMLGIFDSEYAYANDKGLGEPEYASDVVAAASTTKSTPDSVVLNKKSSGRAVSAQELKAVCDYAQEVFASGAREMMSGYCDGTPLVSGNYSECTYCEFKSVCRSMGGKSRDRNKRSVSKAFIVECVNKSEERE